MTAPRPPLSLVEGRVRAPWGPALELAALGAGLTFTMAWIGALPDLRMRLGTFQGLYAVAFAFFGIALLRMRRYEPLPHTALVVVAVAIAARVPLLLGTPSLSDDVYRYIWEGRVLLAGGNPYAQAPLDPALAPLRDRAVYPRINHPELATIYPPLAEAGFALVSRISATVLAFKLWVLLHELVLMGALLVLLARSRQSPLGLIAYAWNPLVIVEFAGSGHHDPTAMAWLALAWVLAGKRPTLSATAFVAGVMVKLAPLLVLPFFLRVWSRKARAVGLVLLAAGLGAYAWLARAESSGLRAYWERWRNNELVFLVLERGLGGAAAARLAVLALVVLAILWAWRRYTDGAAASRAVLRVATIAAPVVHPWYLGWTLMFEPLAPSAPWLLLSLTAVLNYGVFTRPLEGASFHLPVPWRLVEYGVPLLCAAVLASRKRSAA